MMTCNGNYYKYATYYAQRAFEKTKFNWCGWVYEVYCQERGALICESHEWYDTKQEAEHGAIERISLLENGEG